MGKLKVKEIENIFNKFNSIQLLKYLIYKGDVRYV